MQATHVALDLNTDCFASYLGMLSAAETTNCWSYACADRDPDVAIRLLDWHHQMAAVKYCAALPYALFYALFDLMPRAALPW